MLTFDGVDDRATMPHHNSYDLGTGNFTIEAWISINSSVPNGAVPIISSRTTGLQGFLLYVYAGNELLLQLGGGLNLLTQVSTVSLHDGQCHHIAVTRSGTNVRFYLDGVFKGAVTGGTNSMTSTGPIYLGYDTYDNYYLGGSIDEVRLWSVARTDAEILNNYNTAIAINAAGLLAYWTLDEATGQSLTDWTATSNTGILGSSSSVEASDPTRVNGCAHATVTSIFDAKVNNDKLTASPNPFANDTKITMEALSGNYTAEVFTLEGKLVQSFEVIGANEFQIGSELKQGTYVLKISTGTGVQTIRILKK